jgi:hypothetical protein
MFAAALFVSCTSTAPATPAAMTPMQHIQGIRLGMPRDEVRATLTPIATFGRAERRRHEVWTLNEDPRFASLIIGYSPEWTVRFVTAVAKEDGPPIAYADFIDLQRAEHRSAGTSHTYTWATGEPPYSVIAIGTPDRLQYVSIKLHPIVKEED